MSSIILFIKQLFCKHKFELIDGGVEYDYRKKYEDECVCIKCGKVVQRESR